MSNTRILFNWQPSILDRSLAERFRERMAAAGFECLGLVEVRDPGRNQYVEASKTWHREASSSKFLIAVWSNVRPTEVRFADGRLLEGAQDGDIILVDNNEVEHRAPADQTDRWFIRTSVVGMKHTKQHGITSGGLMDGKGEES